MRARFPLLAAFAVLTAISTSAQAGYTIDFAGTIDNTDLGSPGATPGDTFSMSIPGTFSNYNADSSYDPQLGGDLNLYRYLLNGTVDAVNSNVVDYSGTYTIFYNGDDDDTYTGPSGPPDYRISEGTFSLTATFTTGTHADLSGSLVQTLGPILSPPFGDLSARYHGNPVTLTGTYDGQGTTGLISGTLTQDAQAVPEPSTLAMGGLAALFGMGFAARRRRRLAAAS